MVVTTAQDTKLESLRAQMPAVQKFGYFNTGSNGPMPKVVYDAVLAGAREELYSGRVAPVTYERVLNRKREIAALAATIFGADADEMALMHCASEGLATALLGIDWKPGDEIISTTEEHSGLVVPLDVLTRRNGVVVRYPDIGAGGPGVVDAIAASITPRTRVIALSHVLWSTGAVLPLRDIVDLARDRQIMVIVDGAQSAGQVPVDLHALGIDAYAIPGQKWLHGPEGTGLLYVRRDRFADIAPMFSRYGAVDPNGADTISMGARRYELGGFYAPATEGLGAALRWMHEDVGLDWAHERIKAHGARVHNRLAAIDGVSMITPEDAMAGMVNFTISGVSNREITTRLEERGYSIRFIETPPCTASARISVGWWHTEDEIEGLVAAVEDIAAGTRDARG